MTLRPQQIIFACHIKISPGGESEGNVKSREKLLSAPVKANYCSGWPKTLGSG